MVLHRIFNVVQLNYNKTLKHSLNGVQPPKPTKHTLSKIVPKPSFMELK